MAETDNTAPGGVNDPVQMRNTETAALKRIPVSPNSASASSAAKKTIKLKPLVTASADGSSPAPAPKSVAPPSILMNHKPAAPQTSETPKFMSTNTAPIGKIAKPTQEKPIPAANLNDAPTKTVSIPRLQAKMTAKPAVPVSAPAAGTTSTATVTVPKTATVAVPKITPAKPQTAPPLAQAVKTATVSVPKVTPAPAPAPGPAVKTATVSVPKITPAPAPAPGPAVKTATVSVPKITPAPAPAPGPAVQNTATVTVPKANAEPAAQQEAPAIATPKSPTVALPTGDADSTRTQGIQKQAIDQAKMQSGLQGAKPAIKLRPSTGSPQTPETLTPVSPTIKLAPKGDSAVSPVPPAEPAEPAAPAESEKAAQSEVTVTTKIPRKTLQLKPKMPAASNEARLKEQGDIANQNIKSGVEAGDQTIQQAGMDDNKSETPAEQANTGKGKKGAGEPNIIFSISAILAFLVIGYTVFALTAQFLSIWEGKQIPVAGFQQIFEKSKK